MKTIPVLELTRPSLRIEEVKQPDGSFVPGMDYWVAVDFTTDAKINDVVGKYDRVRVQWQKNPSEVWEFFNATVMPHPKSQNNSDWYVLTYNMVQRLSGTAL